MKKISKNWSVYNSENPVVAVQFSLAAWSLQGTGAVPGYFWVGSAERKKNS